MTAGLDTRQFGSDEYLRLVRHTPAADVYGEPLRSICRRVNAILFGWEEGGVWVATVKQWAAGRVE